MLKQKTLGASEYGNKLSTTPVTLAINILPDFLLNLCIKNKPTTKYNCNTSVHALDVHECLKK